MNEIVGNITRKKGYDYKVDKRGNIIEKKYSYFKDPYTYITLVVIIMAWLYYSEVKTARQFVGSPCVEKCIMDKYVQEYNDQHPGVQLTCDYESKRCEYNGVLVDEDMLSLRSYNFTKG